MSHCAAILASTFAKLSGCGTEPFAAIVPFRLIGGSSLETLMLKVVACGVIAINVEGFLGDAGRGCQ